MKMKKFLALLLSAVLAVSMMIPSMVAYTDESNADISVGTWLSLVDSEFGMTYYEQSEPYFENIKSDNIYFGAVQTAVKWNIISKDDDIDVNATVKKDFMAATLVKAANLTKGAVSIKNASDLYCPDAVAIAVGNGIVSLNKNGKLSNTKVKVQDAKTALAYAKNLWATKSFDKDEANVKVAKNVLDLSQMTDSSEATYSAVVTENGNDTITVPKTDKTEMLAKGNVIILPASDAYPFGAVKKVNSVKTNSNSVVIKAADAELDEVFDSIDLESDFAPDFNTAEIEDNTGNLVNEADPTAAEGFSLSGITNVSDSNVMMSLVNNEAAPKACATKTQKPVNINFNVGDFAVAGTINGDKMDFSVSGVVKGIKVTKTYNFTNFNLSTKADVNLLKSKIKEAYIRVDYDVKDSTKVEGNYNTSLAQYNWNKEEKLSDIDELLGTDILNSLQTAADDVSANINNTFKIASVDIPIPNMPVVSVGIDISLRINIDGSIELVVETNNARGYEIINNQGRVINNTVNKENTVNLGANTQLTANFGLSLKLLSVSVVDAALETGVGVDSQTKVSWFKAKADPNDSVTADIPLEVALTLTAGNKYYNVSGDVTIYGILNVSVGQSSKIMKLVGLSKSWDIFNESNAVIYTHHYNEGNLPNESSSEDKAGNVEYASPEAPTESASVASSTVSATAGEKISLTDKGTSWVTSDSSVVAVGEDGTISAVSAGSAVLTGKDADGKTISVTVNVAEQTEQNKPVVVVSAFAPISSVYSI